MTLKSTIYKTDLQIADMRRHYYADHTLTIARHPSETDERMMVRIVAFALFASDTLTFSKGLSDVDEPDLWQKDLTGAIELWIDLGQPDDTRIRKACSRADQTVVVPYSHSTEVWWKPLAGKVSKHHNLTVLKIPDNAAAALGTLTQRTMRLQVTVQDDGGVMVTSDNGVIEFTPVILQSSAVQAA